MPQNYVWHLRSITDSSSRFARWSGEFFEEEDDRLSLSVVFTPDSGHAYPCNVRSPTVIDPTTNDTDDIDTADLPRGLQLSSDGKRAYITNFGDRTLSVVDTITNSVATTVDVPGYPEAVAVSPDGCATCAPGAGLASSSNDPRTCASSGKSPDALCACCPEVGNAGVAVDGHE
jgi:YVTN family beta-propeller protein